jgi:hypothetical protein
MFSQDTEPNSDMSILKSVGSVFGKIRHIFYSLFRKKLLLHMYSKFVVSQNSVQFVYVIENI